MRAAMTPTECMQCLASLPFPSIPVGLQLDTDTPGCMRRNQHGRFSRYPSAGRGTNIGLVV